MLTLENYLEKLNSSDLINILKKYKKIEIFDSNDSIRLGLLKYDYPPKDTVFLFKFTNEKIRVFHTVGMKFPINIHFFGSKGNILYTTGIVNPGNKSLSSKMPTKYVVEEVP